MDPFLLSTLLFSSDSIDDSLSWNAMGFADSVVSIVSDSQQRILVLDTKGRVFRMSAGGRWEEVFSIEKNQLDPEDLLLDAESTMGEILEGVDQGESYYDEETEQTVIEEGQQTFDDEVQGGIFDPLRDGNIQEERMGLFAQGEILLLCVQQCYESDDGERWTEIALPPISDVVSMDVDGKHFVLAATQQGLWYRQERGVWSLANLSLRNVSFSDLEPVERGVLAASDAGLFRSNNALFWKRQGTIKNVQALSKQRERLYLSTPTGLYVSEDEGVQTVQIDDTLEGLLDMRSTEEDVWVLSSDKIYTIRNNIAQDQKRNLLDVTYRALLPWRSGMIVGSDKGVFLLSLEEELMTVTMPHSLEHVLDMVLYDVDKQAQNLAIQNPLLTGALSPVLSLTGSLDRDMTITVDYGGISSSAQERIAWDIGLNICFGRCGSIASTASQSLQEDELMVINGAVYSQGGVAAAASGLELGLNKKRNALFDRTIALYQSHRRLLMQKERVKTNPLSLLDMLLLELDLAEVVAQLNALTHGRYEN